MAWLCNAREGAAPPTKSVNPPASSGRPPKRNYDPDDDPWAAENQQGAVGRRKRLFCRFLGMCNRGDRQATFHLQPAATAKSGFPDHSAAAMGTGSKFPPAKAAAAENSAAPQLPIPKPTGPNKAARNSTPTIAEVPEEDGNAGGRMDESSSRRRRDVFEDEEDLFGFEYIPADVSPPWFPNHLWGIPATVE